MTKSVRALCATLSVSALLCAATPIVNAKPPATPISVDESADTTFVATSTTTVKEINDALTAGKTHVVFTEDVNLTGSIKANTDIHPVTLVIKDGVTVDLTAPGAHAILNEKGSADNPLTISNSGTLKIHGAATGIKSVTASPVTLDGGTFTFRDVTDYNLHFESAKGDLTVRNADVSIVTPTKNVPGAINTGKGVGTVTWDNSTVFIDDQGTAKLDNSAANTAIYSEAGKWVFTNGTQFHSITHNYYNLSLVGTTLEIDKGKADGSCDGSDGSSVTLETAVGANTNRYKWGFGFPHPVVGLNLANSPDSVVNGTLKVIDHVKGDKERHGIELQDSVLTIGDQGHVDTPSVGTDYKQKTGPSVIAITPNGGGTVNTTTHWGNGNQLPDAKKLTFIISKGSNTFDQKDVNSVAAPKAGSHADAVKTFLTKNDIGQPVQGFETKPDTPVTDPLYSYGDAPQDSYTAACTTHPAGTPNVWLPKVKVSFFKNPFTRDPETVTDVPRGAVDGTPGAPKKTTPLSFTTPDEDGPWTVEGGASTFTVPELTSGTKTFNKDTNAYLQPITPVVACPGKDVPTTWLPEDTSGFTYEVTKPADTNTPGDTTQTVKITFPANSNDPEVDGYKPRVERTITVPVTVKNDCQPWKPVTPIPSVTTHKVVVYVGDTVDPKDGLNDLPDDATVTVVTKPDTSQSGETTQKVTVTFADGSSREVTVKVQVKERPTVTATATATTTATSVSAVPTTVVTTKQVPTTVVTTKQVPTTVVTTVNGEPTTIVTTKQVPTTVVTTKQVPTTVTSTEQVSTTINPAPVTTTVTPPPTAPTTVTVEPGSSAQDAIVPVIVGGAALGAALAVGNAGSSNTGPVAPAVAPTPTSTVKQPAPQQRRGGVLAQTGVNTIPLAILTWITFLVGFGLLIVSRNRKTRRGD